MFNDVSSAIRPALVLTLLFALLLGLAYPAALTGAGQLLFPEQANGSLIREGDRVVGSALIGQGFASDRYFHGRPSAAGSDGYDAMASSGSNLGPTSHALVERVTADLAKSPGVSVPPDLVTTSASGLDPHISPEAALFQVARLAAARGVTQPVLRDLIGRLTERPLLGVLGEPRVNVLELNRALDKLTDRSAKASK